MFTYPYHCLQHDKYLIVTDRNEHCIIVFDRDWDCLYNFGKKRTVEGEFHRPRCLLVKKAGQLLVLFNSMTPRVQVFEL